MDVVPLSDHMDLYMVLRVGDYSSTSRMDRCEALLPVTSANDAGKDALVVMRYQSEVLCTDPEVDLSRLEPLSISSERL